MKLASLKGARDGRLTVVCRDLSRAAPAGAIAASLQTALDDWERSAPELAKLADSRRDQVLTLLRELEAAGRVRRTGQRRGTRWHPITDEDRINARATELEQQTRKARSAASRAGRAA